MSKYSPDDGDYDWTPPDELADEMVEDFSPRYGRTLMGL